MANKIKNYFQDIQLKKLLVNFKDLFTGSAISGILGLGSLILTIKSVGVNPFGLFVLAQTYVVIIDQLATFQAWQAIIKFGSELILNKKTDEFKSLIKLAVILDLFGIILSLIISFALLGTVKKVFNWDNLTYRLAFYYSLTLITHFNNSSIGIIRIFSRYKLISNINIVVSSAKFVLLLLLYFFKKDIVFYFAIWIFMDAAYFITLFILSQRTLIKNNIRKWWSVKIINYRQILKFTLWTNIYSTVNIPVNFFDVFIISKFISIIEVGIFKSFKQMAEIIGRVNISFDYVIFPQVSFMVADNNERKSIKLVLKTGFMIFVIGLPFILVAGFTSKLWLNYFFGSAFAKEWTTLLAFLLLKLLAIVFVGINPLFISLGFVKLNTIVSIISNILFIGLAIIFSKYLGLLGIVMAFFVQVIFENIFKLVFIFKKGKINRELIKSKLTF